jgi:hypothetical protein
MCTDYLGHSSALPFFPTLFPPFPPQFQAGRVLPLSLVLLKKTFKNVLKIIFVQMELSSCSNSRFKLHDFKVSTTPSSSLPKRTDEEEDSTIAASDQVSDDTVEMPLSKKLKTVTPVGAEVCKVLSVYFYQ